MAPTRWNGFLWGQGEDRVTKLPQLSNTTTKHGQQRGSSDLSLSSTGKRRWIRIPECAEYLGIAVKSAYDMAAAGKLPVTRVGRLVRVDLRPGARLPPP
ncbi:MAG: helix-turn-helix domain-containing protein [Candidatus Aminicenantes bacterium]|nr:helix-turn-helix domain-containing protein [Candidatus Aminicenantes bacterium]